MPWRSIIGIAEKWNQEDCPVAWAKPHWLLCIKQIKGLKNMRVLKHPVRSIGMEVMSSTQ